ncbi:uncharacterized protein EV422DRAFT_514347 [Fimicolochytrium jonesii]|uniref:uncharacterized protein n=1 Tax=Fimicolochytrium jonesii TaxID=1396493 RepID=UPI0022FF14A0|nr:uncharacterized protein EV422DRAFT_514347 [Fimicolochytrium jonesii]KAI8825820.1 hypothetical protein EV422DRAFT_514347 [Fimicolochytrium jonesii]
MKRSVKETKGASPAWLTSKKLEATSGGQTSGKNSKLPRGKRPTGAQWQEVESQAFPGELLSQGTRKAILPKGSGSGSLQKLNEAPTARTPERRRSNEEKQHSVEKLTANQDLKTSEKIPSPGKGLQVSVDQGLAVSVIPLVAAKPKFVFEKEKFENSVKDMQGSLQMANSTFADISRSHQRLAAWRPAWPDLDGIRSGKFRAPTEDIAPESYDTYPGWVRTADQMLREESFLLADKAAMLAGRTKGESTISSNVASTQSNEAHSQGNADLQEHGKSQHSLFATGGTAQPRSIPGHASASNTEPNAAATVPDTYMEDTLKATSLVLVDRPPVTKTAGPNFAFPEIPAKAANEGTQRQDDGSIPSPSSGVLDGLPDAPHVEKRHPPSGGIDIELHSNEPARPNSAESVPAAPSTDLIFLTRRDRPKSGATVTSRQRPKSGTTVSWEDDISMLATNQRAQSGTKERGSRIPSAINNRDIPPSNNLQSNDLGDFNITFVNIEPGPRRPEVQKSTGATPELSHEVPEMGGFRLLLDIQKNQKRALTQNATDASSGDGINASDRSAHLSRSRVVSGDRRFPIQVPSEDGRSTPNQQVHVHTIHIAAGGHDGERSMRSPRSSSARRARSPRRPSTCPGAQGSRRSRSLSSSGQRYGAVMDGMHMNPAAGDSDQEHSMHQGEAHANGIGDSVYVQGQQRKHPRASPTPSTPQPWEDDHLERRLETYNLADRARSPFVFGNEVQANALIPFTPEGQYQRSAFVCHIPGRSRNEPQYYYVESKVTRRGMREEEDRSRVATWRSMTQMYESKMTAKKSVPTKNIVLSDCTGDILRPPMRSMTASREASRPSTKQSKRNASARPVRTPPEHSSLLIKLIKDLVRSKSEDNSPKEEKKPQWDPKCWTTTEYVEELGESLEYEISVVDVNAQYDHILRMGGEDPTWNAEVLASLMWTHRQFASKDPAKAASTSQSPSTAESPAQSKLKAHRGANGSMYRRPPAKAIDIPSNQGIAKEDDLFAGDAAVSGWTDGESENGQRPKETEADDPVETTKELMALSSLEDSEQDSDEPESEPRETEDRQMPVFRAPKADEFGADVSTKSIRRRSLAGIRSGGNKRTISSVSTFQLEARIPVPSALRPISSAAFARDLKKEANRPHSRGIRSAPDPDSPNYRKPRLSHLDSTCPGGRGRLIPASVSLQRITAGDPGVIPPSRRQEISDFLNGSAHPKQGSKSHHRTSLMDGKIANPPVQRLPDVMVVRIAHRKDPSTRWRSHSAHAKVERTDRHAEEETVWVSQMPPIKDAVSWSDLGKRASPTPPAPPAAESESIPSERPATESSRPSSRKLRIVQFAMDYPLPPRTAPSGLDFSQRLPPLSVQM